MADVVNFVCLHHLEERALVQKASFYMMTEEVVLLKVRWITIREAWPFPVWNFKAWKAERNVGFKNGYELWKL